MKEIIIDPIFIKEEGENYYTVSMYCSNCGKPRGWIDGCVDVAIIKGDKRPVYPLTCPNCGCNSLGK